MARQQRQNHATLITLSDEQLVRHEVLAYADGYADARESGRSGFWLNPDWSKEARTRYLIGFQQGLRVHAVNNKKE